MRWGGTCLVAILLVCTDAHADRINNQVKKLKANSYKVRVSAALQLSKVRDDRAVFALAEALRADSEKTVRQVAALSLGNLVNPHTSPPARTTAVRALKLAARRDRARKVKDAAKASLRRIAAQKSSPAVSKVRALPGAVFLHVGRPNDRTRRLSNRDRGALLTAMSRTIRKRAPTYGMATRKNDLPTQSELERRRLHGFFVGAHVAQLQVVRRGSSAEVRCKVAVRVGPWLGRDGGERIIAGKTASASGSARVIGSGSRRGIATSQRDCVVAVAEELTARQVVPFLRRAAK